MNAAIDLLYINSMSTGTSMQGEWGQTGDDVCKTVMGKVYAFMLFFNYRAFKFVERPPQIIPSLSSYLPSARGSPLGLAKLRVEALPTVTDGGSRRTQAQYLSVFLVADRENACRLAASYRENII